MWREICTESWSPLPRHEGLKRRLRDHRVSLGALLLSCGLTSSSPLLSRTPETNLPPWVCTRARGKGRSRKEGGSDPASSLPLESGPFSLSPGVKISSCILWGGATNTPGERVGPQREEPPWAGGRYPKVARPLKSLVSEFSGV